jgi:hypothetical protein
MQTMIGTVIHYYPRIVGAAVVLKDHLARGGRIHIHGPHEDFDQSHQWNGSTHPSRTRTRGRISASR